MAALKICVFSDSHGDPEPMLSLIGREEPDLCFFLGDGANDLQPVRRRYPGLIVHAVRGNCDLRSTLPQSLTCTVEGVTFFAAHGHRYDVKHDPSLEALRAAGAETGAQVILFGHTHLPYLENCSLPVLMNPGSVSGTRPDYGVLVLHEGRIYAQLKHLSNRRKEV